MRRPITGLICLLALTWPDSPRRSANAEALSSATPDPFAWVTEDSGLTYVPLLDGELSPDRELIAPAVYVLSTPVGAVTSVSPSSQ